ncbi:hypothetical protein [Nocardia sp. NPDC052566]|uniref:hypothetical protein n=1 Tax=Nocardia sp. NPDC052566 TaxID=3364330 RepID=UPI0037C612AA
MTISSISQILQVAGALILLAAFIAAQHGVLTGSSTTYLTLNAVGGALLAALAYLGHDWGFLLLEGAWAAVAAFSLVKAHSSARSSDPDFSASAVSGPRRAPPLPEARAARLIGDELSNPDRLIHLFRDSYVGAQGRQWVQGHILWWVLTFLRDNGVRVDFGVLTSAALRRKVVRMPLPPGHSAIHPAGHTDMNFGLWWSLFVDIARVVYRPWWCRLIPGLGPRLPGLAELERRASVLGLRSWMSSTSYEEISGISRSLAVIRAHERRRTHADDVMMVVLVRELLLVEMHWLHAPDGRPRAGDRSRVDVALLRRYAVADIRWGDRYLSPLDHMYLRAGDILGHLALRRDSVLDPALRPVLELYERVKRADEQPGSAARIMPGHVPDPAAL